MAEIRSDRRAARRLARQEAAGARPQQPQRSQPHPEERKKRSNFIAESWAELKKVEWPKQNQVVQGTTVVIIACVVVGLFLYANDQVWRNVVTKVLLGQ